MSAVNRWARERGCDDSLGDGDMARVSGALLRIAKHAAAANLVIDMLLTNLKDESYSRERIKSYAIAGTIDEAIGRFQFRPGERELIRVRIYDNFIYKVSRCLWFTSFSTSSKMHCERSPRQESGYILIEARTHRAGHLLSVTDTGRGIEPAALPYIFVPFVTGHAEYRRRRHRPVLLPACH